MTVADVGRVGAALEAAPGSYVLVLRCTTPTSIVVGRRGHLDFAPGWYLYVGSALGPGGVRARLGRHLRGGGRCRWHVDYLRARMAVAGAWVAYSATNAEHDWAVALGGHPGLRMIDGVGASDCRCASHLFHACRRPRLARFAAALAARGAPPPRFEWRLRD
ncbi:MAG: GIY-YIG nuclease family protein [Gammaproteobacteria bacterium]|nr:GIY-YIG nuclease family protein [Gammaproteobacteria bacterium]MCP5198976.1 GIY-YIG nuclease family protein [Gammaproteobacteria bacterium]